MILAKQKGDESNIVIMASVFHFVSTLGSKRDDYGVGDLLAEVSKRSSSISADDRQEIAEISRRLRQHRLGGSSPFTPRQTPDNSQHDVKSKPKKDYGKDLLKVDNLLRGFGSERPLATRLDLAVSPPHSPKGVESDHIPPNAVMLRDFGSLATQNSLNEMEVRPCGFEQARQL